MSAQTRHPDDCCCWQCEGEECWNCGGEGVVYVCLDEAGCLYPEEGCDLCERRCWVCTPRKPEPTP
jgi:hypothetical protein